MDTFKPLSNLVALDLSYNHLSRLDGQALSHLRSLQVSVKRSLMGLLGFADVALVQWFLKNGGEGEGGEENEER